MILKIHIRSYILSYVLVNERKKNNDSEEIFRFFSVFDDEKIKIKSAKSRKVEGKFSVNLFSVQLQPPKHLPRGQK